MSLTTLKPRVTSKTTPRIKVLDRRAGSTERTQGRAWMAIRNKWIAEHPACVSCGRVSLSNQVDHIVPLFEGGADDESNYQTLCVECHKAKTAGEAKERGRSS